MVNALDKIECVPVVGGQKTPYKIVSHPYCIDVITAYFQLSKREFVGNKDFLKSVEEGIRYYCSYNNIDFSYHFNNKLPLTIPPTVNNIQWYFAIQIMSFDTNKIKALLSFQQKRYLDTEIDYVTYIEFSVYPIVYSINSLDNSLHLKLIMEWVNEERAAAKFIIGSENKKQTNKTTKNKGEKKQQKIKIIHPSFYLLALKSTPEYFVKNASSIMEAFKQLKGGGFISQETNYNHFKSIFTGQLIKRENRIEWSGSVVELNMFIQFLMVKKIMKLNHNKWETVANCFVKNGLDLDPVNIRKAQGKKHNQQKLKEIVNLI